MNHHSPRRLRLLDRLLPAHQALVGDLEHLYHDVRHSKGRIRASLWLWMRFLTTVPRIYLNDLIWESHMFRNYLTVALRQIRKYRGFSAINIPGLAFSLSICLLIMSVIVEQRSFDEFHPDGDRLYRLTSKTTSEWGSYYLATSSAVLGGELAQEDLGIEQLVQLRRTRARLVRDDGRMANFKGLYASSGFFDLFGFNLANGDPRTALSGPRRIVLSRDLAAQLFPDREPVGQQVELDNLGSYTVSGVMAPMSEKTHLKFEALVSFDTLHSLLAEGHEIPLDSWTDNYQFYNYMKLAVGARTDAVVRAANRLGEVHQEDQDMPSPVFDMQLVSSVNLGKDFSNEIGEVTPAGFAVGLSLMALVLVFMAVFNYVNLTTARSMRRMHEIGIRKVVGAHRRQLFQQFVSEAVMTALLALGVSLILLQWLIPQFNGLSSFHGDGRSMQIEGLDAGLIIRFFLLAVIVGLIAGIIPAIRLSGLATVRVLKGLSSGMKKRRITLRKSLTVLQFSLSIIAIVMTVTLYRQASYVIQVDYGFDEAQLLHIELNGVDYDRVSGELARIPGVELVAGTSAPPSGGSHTQTGIRLPDMENPIPISTFSVDDAFLDQYNVELILGRNLSRDIATDEEGGLLLTASSIPYLQLESVDDAVGLQVEFNDRPVTIVGVVENFYSSGFEDGYRPVALDFKRGNLRYAAVRISPVDISGTLDRIEEAWESIAPGIPASWTFFDDAKNARYAEWNDTIRILGLFAFLIVVIASLGLLGMTAFNVEIRLREVGIRKVLGADIRQVMTLLSADYVKLVTIAAILAAPVSYVLADQALALSANHVSLGPLTILAGILPVVLLALITICSQTLRAAVTNPAEVIRDD